MTEELAVHSQVRWRSCSGHNRNPTGKWPATHRTHNMVVQIWRKFAEDILWN